MACLDLTDRTTADGPVGQSIGKPERDSVCACGEDQERKKERKKERTASISVRGIVVVVVVVVIIVV